jgi:hypothetical protein
MANEEREHMLSAKLDDIEKERLNIKDQLDRERLIRVTSEEGRF